MEQPEQGIPIRPPSGRVRRKPKRYQDHEVNWTGKRTPSARRGGDETAKSPKQPKSTKRQVAGIKKRKQVVAKPAPDTSSAVKQDPVATKKLAQELGAEISHDLKAILKQGQKHWVKLTGKVAKEAATGAANLALKKIRPVIAKNTKDISKNRKDIAHLMKAVFGGGKKNK